MRSYPERDSSEEDKDKDEDKDKGEDKDKDKDKAKTDPGGVPLGGPNGRRAYQAVRTDTYKYVEYDNGERELYNLDADPYELESLHESTDPSLLKDLQAKLDALKSCSEDGCREAEDAP